MNEEIKKKIYREPNINRIPLHKKLWYSITKFERYPEMAAEGVGKAFGYLTWLIFMFAIIIAIGLIIKFNFTLKSGIKYLNENFSEINYNDGKLTIQTDINDVKSDVGNVIINTGELTEEQRKQYENSSANKPQFIWLNDKVIAKVRSRGV